MGVSRLELVELIEGEVSTLSPRGRDLWESLELHVETEAPEDATPATLPPPDPQQAQIGRLMGELPLREQGILEQFMELLAGLHSSDYAEKRGQPGESGHDEAVLAAAGIKDHRMGRRIDPDRTPEQAVARLRELG
jgi:hypothetical protein